MSQVDILLPQNALSVACDLRKSPHRDTSYVKEKGEPSVGRTNNDKDKQRQNGASRAVVEWNNFNNGECKKSAKNNTDAKAQKKAFQPKKKKNRRGKKRKWKPYNKLTWEERKELQEREARRAERVRAEMCACGLTLAPYNTTQFLMEDHNLQEPDFAHIAGNHHRPKENGNGDSSDDFYSSPSDEEDFLQQQFTETYRNIHAERLSDMTKDELVQELMSVEDRLEGLQKRLDDLSASDRKSGEGSSRLDEQLEKVRVFKEEITKLTVENEKLRRENDELKILSAQVPMDNTMDNNTSVG